MNVAVLIPCRPDGGYRDDVRAWLLERWEREHPTWPVHLGEPDDGPFNRAQAINRAAVAAGDWDVAVIADGDSFCDAGQLRGAVKLAADTDEMVLAYTCFRYLNAKGSEKVMGGFLGDWLKFTEWTMTGTCSSMIAVSRSLWGMVGGFDECFRGWGFEDVGFSLACQGSTGQRRVDGDLWHLWHPSSNENNWQSPDWQANRERMERYADALRAGRMAEFLALAPEDR